MKTLFKSIMIPAIVFGALDWAADHPIKTKALRNKVVKQFEKGRDLAASELDQVTQ